jgi:hypothetical protein
MEFNLSFIYPGLLSSQITVTSSVSKRVLGQLSLLGASSGHSLHAIVIIYIYLLTLCDPSISIFCEESCLEDLLCYCSTRLAFKITVLFNEIIFLAICAPVNIIYDFSMFFFLFFIIRLADRFFGRNIII